MDEACESNSRDVTGAAVDAFEIPDGFGRFGVDLVKEALSILLATGQPFEIVCRPYSSVLFGKDTCEAPWLVLQWLYVLNVYHENVSWLGSLNVERSCEIVDSREIDISHIIGRVIVADLSSCPVYTFDLDCLAILDVADGRNLMMLGELLCWRIVLGRTVRVPSVL